jgi:hypothetical protein
MVVKRGSAEPSAFGVGWSELTRALASRSYLLIRPDRRCHFADGNSEFSESTERVFVGELSELTCQYLAEDEL